MSGLILIASMLLIGGSIFLLTGPVRARGGERIARFEKSLQEVLAELFVFDTKPRTITYVVAGVVGFVMLVNFLLLGPLCALAAGVIVLFFPGLIIKLLIKRRRAKLDTQLMDGLVTLANGMRAGLNLPQAIALIENHTKPLSQEFGLIMREIEHGASIDVALDNASRRIKSHNFKLLFAALKTTRKRGGNLPETLDRLGESLREIIRLEEKVRAQTAKGRTEALVMGLMPLVFLLIYYAFDQPGVTLMFTDWRGQWILFGVAVLNLVGFLWIRKIVSFEI